VTKIAGLIIFYYKQLQVEKNGWQLSQTWTQPAIFFV